MHSLGYPAVNGTQRRGAEYREPEMSPSHEVMFLAQLIA
jgi:hypothetical protein